MFSSLLICDLESVEGFTGGRDVEYTCVDRVWDGIDELTKHKFVTTLVDKELRRVCRDKETIADVGVIFEDLDEEKWKTGVYGVGMIRRLLSLVLVDGVADVGI